MSAEHGRETIENFAFDATLRVMENRLVENRKYELNIHYDDGDIVRFPVRVLFKTSSPPEKLHSANKKVGLVPLDSDSLPMGDLEVTAGFSDGFWVSNRRESVNQIGGLASTAFLTELEEDTAGLEVEINNNDSSQVSLDDLLTNK